METLASVITVCVTIILCLNIILKFLSDITRASFLYYIIRALNGRIPNIDGSDERDGRANCPEAGQNENLPRTRCTIQMAIQSKKKYNEINKTYKDNKRRKNTIETNRSIDDGHMLSPWEPKIEVREHSPQNTNIKNELADDSVPGKNTGIDDDIDSPDVQNPSTCGPSLPNVGNVSSPSYNTIEHGASGSGERLAGVIGTIGFNVPLTDQHRDDEEFGSDVFYGEFEEEAELKDIIENSVDSTFNNDPVEPLTYNTEEYDIDCEANRKIEPDRRQSGFNGNQLRNSACASANEGGFDVGGNLGATTKDKSDANNDFPSVDESADCKLGERTDHYKDKDTGSPLTPFKEAQSFQNPTVCALMSENDARIVSSINEPYHIPIETAQTDVSASTLLPKENNVALTECPLEYISQLYSKDDINHKTPARGKHEWDINVNASAVAQGSETNDENVNFNSRGPDHMSSSPLAKPGPEWHVSSWVDLSVDELTSTTEGEVLAETKDMHVDVGQSSGSILNHSNGDNVGSLDSGLSFNSIDIGAPETHDESVPGVDEYMTDASGSSNDVAMGNECLDGCSDFSQCNHSLEIVCKAADGEQTFGATVIGGDLEVHSQHGSYNEQVIGSWDEGYNSFEIILDAGSENTLVGAEVVVVSPPPVSSTITSSSSIQPRPELMTERASDVHHIFIEQDSDLMFQAGRSNRQILMERNSQESRTRYSSPADGAGVYSRGDTTDAVDIASPPVTPTTTGSSSVQPWPGITSEPATHAQHTFTGHHSELMPQANRSNRQRLVTSSSRESSNKYDQRKRDHAPERASSKISIGGKARHLVLHMQPSIRCRAFVQVGNCNRQMINGDELELEHVRAFTPGTHVSDIGPYWPSCLKILVIPSPKTWRFTHMAIYTLPVLVMTSDDNTFMPSIDEGMIVAMRRLFQDFGLEVQIAQNPGHVHYDMFTFRTDEPDKAIDYLKFHISVIKEIYCITRRTAERACHSFPSVDDVRCTFWVSESHGSSRKFVTTI